MKIDDIKNKIENNKKIRDSLVEIKKELLELSQDEKVQRYIELNKFFDNNSKLYGKTDDQILNEVIYSNNVDDRKVYFCYGKNYKGQITKTGKYYVLNGASPFNESLKYGMVVALYRNIYNIHDEVVLPVDECEQFEKENEVIFSKQLNPDSEYLDLKKEYYKKELEKKYVLKP